MIRTSERATIAALDSFVRSFGGQLVVAVARARSEGDDLNHGCAELRRRGARAVLVNNYATIGADSDRVAKTLVRYGLPGIMEVRRYAESGVLMTYSDEDGLGLRRVAEIIDRILRGANPAELPLFRPMRFELVVNLKTAKALGLTIPQSVLLRAGEVIQ